MHIKGMNAQNFATINNQSYINTEKRLGNKPDLLSAAKTTFSIPKMSTTISNQYL